MEKNHHRHRQQPCDFFNIFSETQPQNEENYITYKGQQKSSSSSSANKVVSTELSLYSTFSPSPSSSSSTKTKTKHTHQCFPVRNTKTKRKPSKPNQNKPCYSNTEKEKTNKSCNQLSSNISLSSSSSTTLKLYDDPWKIKKVLTASDLGKLNRLLLSSDSMENLIVSVLGGDNLHHENNNNDDDEGLLMMKGRAVRVWDVETKSMHKLILKRWASFKNYVLIGDWNQDFVKRRALKKGDEIGFQWDPYNFCFNFSVLNQVIK